MSSVNVSIDYFSKESDRFVRNEYVSLHWLNNADPDYIARQCKNLNAWAIVHYVRNGAICGIAEIGRT